MEDRGGGRRKNAKEPGDFAHGGGAHSVYAIRAYLGLTLPGPQPNGGREVFGCQRGHQGNGSIKAGPQKGKILRRTRNVAEGVVEEKKRRKKETDLGYGRVVGALSRKERNRREERKINPDVSCEPISRPQTTRRENPPHQSDRKNRRDAIKDPAGTARMYIGRNRRKRGLTQGVTKGGLTGFCIQLLQIDEGKKRNKSGPCNTIDTIVGGGGGGAKGEVLK